MFAFFTDFRQGFRSLRRSPLFTLAATVTLALGIGANTAAFSLMNRLVLGIVPFDDADRIVMIHGEMPERGHFYFDLSAPDFLDIQRDATSFESMAAWNNKRVNLAGEGDPLSVQAGRVSWTFFSTLGARPQVGRGFEPEEDAFGGPRVAILSYELWQTRFGGDHSILGRDIRLDGTPHKIIGVMGPEFGLPFTLAAYEADLYVPIAFTPQQLQSRNSRGLWSIGRLKPGVSVVSANQEVKAIAGRLAEEYSESNAHRTATVYPIRNAAFRATRLPALVLLGITALVLLIACTNVANLLLAKGLDRRREMAIRTAMGAGTRTLLRQMVSENLALALLGGTGGLLVARGVMGVFPVLLPILESVGPFTLDGRVLTFVMAVTLMSVLVFGALPAWQTTRVNPAELLQDANRGSGGRAYHRARSALVVLEVALATTLLVGTGLMLRSLRQLEEVRPGFEPANLLTTNCVRPESKYPDFESRNLLYERLVDRVSAIPGVKAAALTDTLPLGTSRRNNAYEVMGQPQLPGESFLAFERSVTPGFFTSMGIPLLQGRDFRVEDANQNVVIVNEHIANTHWPGESPLGKLISVGDAEGWARVIGVVGNVRQDSLRESPHGEAYKPMAQEGLFPYVSFAVRFDGDPRRLIPVLEQAVADVDPDLALYDTRTGQELLGRKLQVTSAISSMISGFGLLALLLAAVGLNGVMSFLVGLRTREIGIRVALGAHVGDIMRMVLGDGLRMVGLGAALGLIGAVGLGRVMTGLLFGVGSTDLTTFLTVPLVLAAVALTSCLFPVIRAVSLEPAAALRDR